MKKVTFVLSIIILILASCNSSPELIPTATITPLSQQDLIGTSIVLTLTANPTITPTATPYQLPPTKTIESTPTLSPYLDYSAYTRLQSMRGFTYSTQNEIRVGVNSSGTSQISLEGSSTKFVRATLSVNIVEEEAEKAYEYFIILIVATVPESETTKAIEWFQTTLQAIQLMLLVKDNNFELSEKFGNTLLTVKQQQIEYITLIAEPYTP
jgi:hypothetical protein